MTTTVTCYGTTLRAPGVIPRPSPAEADIWWPGGDTVLAMNGRRTPATFAVPVPHVMFDGVVLVPPPIVAPVIEHGQSCRLRKPGAPPPSFTVTGDHSGNPYIYGLSFVPPSLIPGSALGWGPAATLTPVTQGGSSALFGHRVVPAVAAIMRAHAGATTSLADGSRRLDEELLAGDLIYEIDPALPEPVWWSALAEPTLCLFQGYGASRGGWKKGIGGSVLPPTVTWPNSGLQCPEQDHAAIETMAAYAVLASDPIALANARAGMQSLVSSMSHETSTGGRGLGHALRCLCHVILAERQLGYPTSQWHPVLDFILDEIEKRRSVGPGETFTPFTDRGNSTDAYHLAPSDVSWLVDKLVGAGIITEAKRPEVTTLLAKSCTTFFAGILAAGAVSWLHLLPDWITPAQRTRLWAVMETTVQWLVVYGGGPITIAPGVIEVPDYPLHDDVSTGDKVGLPVEVRDIWLGKGHPGSTAARFIQPALLGYLWVCDLAGLGDNVWLRSRVRSLSLAIRAKWGPWKRHGSEVAGTFEVGWEMPPA